MLQPVGACVLFLLPSLLALVWGQVPCAGEAGCPTGSADQEHEDLSVLQMHTQPSRPGTGLHLGRAAKKISKIMWKCPIQSMAEAAMQKKLGLPDSPEEPHGGEADALGLLILSYGYPTQPGDIDDKRSFCTVDENYDCTDGFSIIKAEVQGLSFELAQSGNFTDALNKSFTKAVRALLKHPRVRAITSNCGYMAAYSDQVDAIVLNLHKTENLERKPLLMGSLGTAPMITSQTDDAAAGIVGGWNLLPSDKRVVIVTANSVSLTKGFYQIMERQGVDVMSVQQMMEGHTGHLSDDQLKALKQKLEEKFGVSVGTPDFRDAMMAALVTRAEANHMAIAADMIKNSGKYFRTFGAQSVTGFGKAVADGTAHNATKATPYFAQWVSETIFRIAFYDAANTSAFGFIMECTELPAYSNGVRVATGLPVWDITTVAKCLMVASPSFDPDKHISHNEDFKACMLSWVNPFKLEPRFGYQTSGEIVGYSNGTVPARHVLNFDWGLFGKPTGDRCSADIQCYE